MGWQRETSVQNSMETRFKTRMGTKQGRRPFPDVGWAHRYENIAQLYRNINNECNFIQFLCLYLLYRGIFVIITGKFRRGDERSVRDPKTWKATFRCALNSLPDVQEVPNMSEKRGPNAYRVYQFLEPKKSRKARKSSGKFVNIFNAVDGVAWKIYIKVLRPLYKNNFTTLV